MDATRLQHAAREPLWSRLLRGLIDLEYLRKNYLNAALQLLGGIMAYRLGLMIADNPGINISGWIFALAPVIVLSITIAVIKISAQEGLNISTFFSLSL